MAGNCCPFLIRGVRRIHGLEGPAHLAGSGALQEQIQLLQAGTRDSSRHGREGKHQTKQPNKCQHLVWFRLCPGLISMDLGQKVPADTKVLPALFSEDPFLFTAALPVPAQHSHSFCVSSLLAAAALRDFWALLVPHSAPQVWGVSKSSR